MGRWGGISGIGLGIDISSPPVSFLTSDSFVRKVEKRRARDSNSQPLAGHHISSVAGPHNRKNRSVLGGVSPNGE